MTADKDRQRPRAGRRSKPTRSGKSPAVPGDDAVPPVQSNSSAPSAANSGLSTDNREAIAPRLLRPIEVAVIFRCSRRTIRNWVSRGLLHPIRIGRTVYFAAPDLQQLVRSRLPPGECNQ